MSYSRKIEKLIKNLKRAQKEADKTKRDMGAIGKLAPRDNNKPAKGQGPLA